MLDHQPVLKLKPTQLKSFSHFHRLKIFRGTVQKVFATTHAQSVAVEDIKKTLHEDFPDERFTEDEIQAAINEMEEANQIMVSEGMAFLI